MAFYQKLSQVSLNNESIVTIGQLAEVVYNNTPDSYADTFPNGTHVLRRMVSEFIAIHRDRFTASATFMRFLHQQGELGGDVLKATV